LTALSKVLPDPPDVIADAGDSAGVHYYMMRLPVPARLEQEPMHRVIDDENPWLHDASIAEPVTRTWVQEIVISFVEGVQRW
jgi:hypothetical protein